MNYKILNKLRKHKFNNPSTKLVALTLACIANEKGDNLYASLETMAEETGLGIATVRRAYRELENTNVIVKTTDSKGYHVNKYAFTPAWIQQDPKPNEQPQTTRHSPFNYTAQNGRTVTFPPSQSTQPPKAPQPEPPKNGFTQVHEGVQKALERAILLRQQAKAEEQTQ